MSPYQSFYPQMNNNCQMPMQNPYMERMAQLQQYQQNLQQPMSPTQMSGTSQQMNVIGKIVASIDVVKATDVPMDGSMYYFPKADGTEIFGKQWLSNGQTRILNFKPVLYDNTNNVSNTEEKLKFEGFESVLTDISENVDSILEKINEITTPQKTNAKTKKELSE